MFFLLLIVSLFCKHFFSNILVSFSIRILLHFHACIHHQLQRRLNITLRGLFLSIRSLYATSFTSLIVNSFPLLFVLIHTISKLPTLFSFCNVFLLDVANFFYALFSYSFHIPRTPIAKFLVYYFFTKSFCKNRLFHILLLNPRFRRIIDRKHWKKRKSKVYARNIGGGSILSNNRFPRQLSRFVHRDVEQWREREKEREVGSSKWRKPSVVCSGVGRGFNGKCGGKLSSSFKEWTNRMAISFGMTWI